MVVSHNMVAMYGQRQFNKNAKVTAKTTEKLSSGYRINRSADDAAGLAISEKMRRQVRGLTQAAGNVQDGVSFCQVADGALQEMDSILDRMTELTVKAANDTNTPEERRIIDDEIQQLKLALKDISNNTEYNEKYIFRSPYVPEINGSQNDTKVFMDSIGSYGGLTINHIRYTWDELGVLRNPDGSFKKNQIKFQTWDNETVELETKGGDLPPNISRIYKWAAKNDGIYINNKLASTWAGMGMDVTNIELREYSFQFHGMDISFSITEPGTNLEDVLDGINGNGINDISWQTVAAAEVPEKAVDITSVDDSTSYYQKLQITQANKNWIYDSTTPYSILASNTGVTLHTNADPALGIQSSHTFTGWSQFKNIDPDEDSFPIVDWGLTNGSATASDISLDDTATYRYKDNNLGITYHFSLADEASLEGAINGLSTDITQVALTAPVKTSTVDGGSDFVTDTKLEFSLQRDLGRNFDSPDQKIGNYTVKIYQQTKPVSYPTTRTEYSYTYAVDLGSGTTFMGSTSWSHSSYPPNWPLKLTNDQYPQSYIAINPSNAGFAGQREISIAPTDYAYQYLRGDESTTGNSSTRTAFNLSLNTPRKMVSIQAGAEAGQHIDVTWEAVNLTTLGLASLNTLTRAESEAGINQIKHAKAFASKVRSDFGAYQNRMEHTIRNLNNVTENTSASESAIRDADMPRELVALSTHNILAQSAASVLAQSNQSNQGVLSLLQS